MTTDSDNDLNREIARLCGWTCKTIRPYGDAFDEPYDEWRDPANGYHRQPPAYDTDPAAALTLLDYTLRQKLYGEYPLSVYEIRYDPATGLWTTTIEAVRQNRSVPDVFTGTGERWTGEGETLTLAIARVCRDVLAAVREGETT